ncbi:protein phosphatase 1 regulatory subunit 3G [Hyperolius riggenbachi]|uniref:protein phosphatase 1 regulatory subunit 3G n=1 Tax=Hyperolius riggenbachi TaxID=752182 RepID=UPI0035A30DEB
MQEQRFCLQANMHGNAGEQLSATLTTEQQSNTFQRLDNCEAQPRAALEQPLLTNLHQQYLVSVGDDLEQQQDMNEELHGATGVQELQYNAPRLEISPVAPQLGEESLLQQTDSATGVEALYCPGCQEIAILEEEDPQTELQGKLSSLHLGEHKAYLKRKAYSFNRERGAFQSFPSHDVRLPISDIRYPEHLATEESPRRRARSLPWNSIPEVEEEEDSLLCCCKLKKRVQFADSLGLTLTSVKHFLPSDEPQVPPAVLARLQSFPPTVSAQRTEQLLQDELISADLAPSSSTPVELLERLNEQGMCLEKVSSSSFGVRGYVLVKDPGENAQEEGLSRHYMIGRGSKKTFQCY